MPEPVIGEGTVVVIVCPVCLHAHSITPKIYPTSAGGFICGLAGAVDDMKKSHECPPQPPELKLV